MREIPSTITAKGQVTIPAEVRKHLALEKGDTIAFVIEDDGSVRVKAIPTTLLFIQLGIYVSYSANSTKLDT